MGFRCRACGEWHDELPMDFGVDEPDYADARAPEPRDSEDTGTGDFRVLEQDDGTHYFVRGVIEIPLKDADDAFCFGVWVSLGADSYAKAREAYRRNEAAGPFFGSLSNRLSVYPDTLNLKTSVQIRPDLKPAIILEPTDHPLAVDQRAGMTLDQVVQVVGRLLHGEEPAADE